MRSAPRFIIGLMVGLAALAACSRASESTNADPSSAASAGSAASTAVGSTTNVKSNVSSETGEQIAELTATVKLVAQEYALAVDDGGAVVDDTEIAEAELFTDQARSKYQRLGEQVKTAHGEEVKAIGQAIDALAQAIAGRRPPSDVHELASNAARALGEIGPPESAATAGLRTATDQADRTIVAEKVAGDYRIGIFVEPPRKLFRAGPDGQTAEIAPPQGATSFVGVVLRERRTKRFLSGARLAISLQAPSQGAAPAQVVTLDGIWADFPQYGGHLGGLADGPGTMHVHVDPPECARHGDMLHHADKPADADFSFTALGGRPALTPERPGPQDADYTIGDDILRGLTEARELVAAGGYRVGFIAEGPEPFWLWKNGPELKPVGAGATHHLEILLLDTASGLLVPGANVSLTLTPATGGAPAAVPLHELMSAYQHYGETLAVAPGEYEVRVDVEPPRLELSDPRRLLRAATATFHWSVPATKERGA